MSVSLADEPVQARPDAELTSLSASTAENDNLPVHEDKARGVYVKNLTDFYVSSSSEVYEIMRQGGNARAVAATSKSVGA